METIEDKKGLKQALQKTLIESGATFGEALDASEWLVRRVRGEGLRFLREQNVQEALKEANKPFGDKFSANQR